MEICIVIHSTIRWYWLKNLTVQEMELLYDIYPKWVSLPPPYPDKPVINFYVVWQLLEYLFVFYFIISVIVFVFLLFAVTFIFVHLFCSFSSLIMFLLFFIFFCLVVHSFTMVLHMLTYYQVKNDNPWSNHTVPKFQDGVYCTLHTSSSVGVAKYFLA